MDSENGTKITAIYMVVADTPIESAVAYNELHLIFDNLEDIERLSPKLEKLAQQDDISLKIVKFSNPEFIKYIYKKISL